jgi:hypothetical protein
VRPVKLAALLLPLTPLLLGGCGSSTGAAAAAPATTGSPWIVSLAGSATPSPTPRYSYSAPAPFPTGFLPTASAATSPTPTPSGAPCTGNKFNAGTINAATVVPSTTGAVVSWFNPGGSDLVEYRITAISQDLKGGTQRDVGWTVITPGTSCGTLSAPITGLDSKTDYVFSVDAVVRLLGKDGTRASTVARSIVVRTS